MKPSFTFFVMLIVAWAWGIIHDVNALQKPFHIIVKSFAISVFQGDLKPRLREEVVSLD